MLGGGVDAATLVAVLSTGPPHRFTPTHLHPSMPIGEMRELPERSHLVISGEPQVKVRG